MMAGHEGNPFHNITWLAPSTDDPNTECPNAGNSNQPQSYQLQIHYLPNKCDALQAHMHKVHKIGNTQTNTSYYTYYQNQINNKSAHSKISNAFWSMPGKVYAISHKEKGRVLKYQSGKIYNQKQAVRLKQSNSLSCPICTCQDSTLRVPASPP